jgi:hypothetical protein
MYEEVEELPPEWEEAIKFAKLELHSYMGLLVSKSRGHEVSFAMLESTKRQVVGCAASLKKAVIRVPQFQSAEFKSISDYVKCIAREGKKSTPILCATALFICIGRRLIPFVKK